jgi:AcrR family transcriptional regulator
MVEGLRERKKVKTRQALADAGMKLFAKKGFESTTVDEIADTAMVSRSTFFRYFPTKEAIVFQHQPARLAMLQEFLAARRRGESPVRATIRACLELSDEFMSQRDDLCRQHGVIQKSPLLIAKEMEVDREWEAAIARSLSKENGSTAKSKRRARVQAGAILGIVRASLREWYKGGCRKNLRTLGEEAFAFIDFETATGGHQKQKESR